MISRGYPLINSINYGLQAIFPCLMELWQSPQLFKLNPKVVELLIATVRHFYSSEKLIDSKFTEFFKSEFPGAAGSKTTGKSATTSTAVAEPVGDRTPGSTTSAPATGAAAPATGAAAPATGVAAPPPPPPPSSQPPAHPSVNPHYLQQLTDMGFSRERAEEALVACANDVQAAMDWIFIHPSPGPSSAATDVSHNYYGMALTCGMTCMTCALHVACNYMWYLHYM